MRGNVEVGLVGFDGLDDDGRGERLLDHIDNVLIRQRLSRLRASSGEVCGNEYQREEPGEVADFHVVEPSRDSHQ